jgi:hypothetical protein
VRISDLSRRTAIENKYVKKGSLVCGKIDGNKAIKM